MDFTELYSASSTVVSPNNALILSATPALLVLRDADSFQVLQSWRNPNGSGTGKPWTQLAFSADSAYCVAADLDNGTAHVFSVDSEQPVATVQAGPEGLQGIRWINTRMGNRLLACWSRHGIRVTIWDLQTGRQHLVNAPKRSASAGWAVHPAHGDYLVVLERHRGKDYLGLYELETVSLIKHIALPTTDAHDLSWSPCGKYIAVWESSLEYALHILTPDGRLLASHTLPGSSSISGLGVRTVAWHPSGRFLAVGGYDERIRILNDISWTCLSEVDFPGSLWVRGGKKAGRILVHKEPSAWLSGPSDSGPSSGIVTFDVSLLAISSLASHTPSSKPFSSSSGTSSKTGAKDLGITSLAFSRSSRYLHATSASAPNRLFLIKFTRCAEALPFTAARPRVLGMVTTNQPIVSSAWKPRWRQVASNSEMEPEDTVDEEECLALATGEKSVLLWRASSDSEIDDEEPEEEVIQAGEGRASAKPGIIEGIGVPSKAAFEASRVYWSSDGKCMVLGGKDKFCLAFPLPAAQAEA